VYGMVKQTGGDVTVYSERGRGSTFTLYFPNVPDSIVAEPAEVADSLPCGSETILVVEDDPAVRGVTVRMLEQLGYATLSAPGGAEALEMIRDHSGTIDLLLTDVIMPGMNGGQLANELAAVRPKMKVLYLSGHTVSAAFRRGIVNLSAAFLPKPFRRDALAKAIRDVLENRGSANQEHS
jgi:DNA-binding NtrC family response regulator